MRERRRYQRITVGEEAEIYTDLGVEIGGIVQDVSEYGISFFVPIETLELFYEGQMISFQFIDVPDSVVSGTGSVKHTGECNGMAFIGCSVFSNDFRAYARRQEDAEAAAVLKNGCRRFQ